MNLTKLKTLRIVSYFICAVDLASMADSEGGVLGELDGCKNVWYGGGRRSV